MTAARARTPQELNDNELPAAALDESAHHEMCLLYRESSDTVRFAKVQQWKTLGATLLLFGGLIVLRQLYPRAELFGHVLLAVSLAVSAGAVYALGIYQDWQNTERTKLNAIASRFSGLAQRVRAIKSRREANLFRYLLLAFMIGTILMGELILLMVLTGNVR